MGHKLLGERPSSDIKTEINAAHYYEAENNCQWKKSTIQTYYNQVKYNLFKEFFMKFHHYLNLHFNFISQTEMIALMTHVGEIDQKKRSLIWKKHKRNETFTEKIMKEIIVVIIYMGRRKLGKIKVKMANRPF